MLRGLGRFRAWDDEDILLEAGVKGPLTAAARPFMPPVSRAEKSELRRLRKLGRAKALRAILAPRPEPWDIREEDEAPPSRWVEEGIIDWALRSRRRGRPRKGDIVRERYTSVLPREATPASGGLPVSATELCVKKKVDKQMARGAEWEDAFATARARCAEVAECEKVAIAEASIADPEMPLSRLRRVAFRKCFKVKPAEDPLPTRVTASEVEAARRTLKIAKKQRTKVQRVASPKNSRAVPPLIRRKGLSGFASHKRRKTKKQQAHSVCMKKKINSFKRKGLSQQRAFGKASKACRG